MGWDLLLIATTANGVRVPIGAKCCICRMLLDDGVGLSGCDHNACYLCMKKAQTSGRGAQCPLDGEPFDARRYIHLSPEIEEWLANIKLKCKWFDGQTCQATAIALRNAHRHSQVCRNNPDNKKSTEQIKTTKFVQNWMKMNNRSNDHKSDIGLKDWHGLDGISVESSKSESIGRIKPRSGYGFRPNKRAVGPAFFPKSMDPEFDPDWRK